jgi:hypothetical protein
MAVHPCQLRHLKTGGWLQQDGAKYAEENAEPMADKATKKAGEAAHSTTKQVHQKKDELDLPSKVDQATDEAVKQTKEAPAKAGSAAGQAAKKVRTVTELRIKHYHKFPAIVVT